MSKFRLWYFRYFFLFGPYEIAQLEMRRISIGRFYGCIINKNVSLNLKAKKIKNIKEYKIVTVFKDTGIKI